MQDEGWFGAQLRSLGLLTWVIVGVVALAWAPPMPAMVQLLAKTLLVMGGTGHPLVDHNGPGQSVEWSYPSHPLGGLGLADPAGVPSGYVLAVHDNYVVPSGLDDEQYSTVAVYSPQEFFPVYGARTFDDSVAAGFGNLGACLRAGAGCVAHIYPNGVETVSYVIASYSQSAVIVSLVKQDLLDNAGTAPAASFVLLANPMRPNGGILQRAPRGMTIPFLGVTAYGPTPTHSCTAQGDHCAFPTVDIAQQYDALGGDFPIYPLHLPALANSLAAYFLLHGNVPNRALDDAVSQGVYGDTSYYLLATDLVPLLMPFDGFVPRPLLVALDAPLRVLIEAGYRRDISPGEPTPAYLIPVINPVSLVMNLMMSVPVGIDNAIEQITGERPLRTKDPGLYGVGGDDDDLSGLPPGLVPLGSTSPTPITVQPMVETPPQQPVSVQEPVSVPEQPVSVPEPTEANDEVLIQDSDPTPPGKPIIRRSAPLTPLSRDSTPTEDASRVRQSVDTATATSSTAADLGTEPSSAVASATPAVTIPADEGSPGTGSPDKGSADTGSADSGSADSGDSRDSDA